MIRRRLRHGDFQVAGQVTVERKTADDFAVSLTQGRLFVQVADLAASAARSALVVEGELARVRSELDPAALRGALVSISVAWQVPVLHTEDPGDTASLLVTIGQQARRPSNGRWNRSGRPRKSDSRASYVLQGLPGVGPELARRLLDRFGSIQRVACADVRTLSAVPGIGLNRAIAITRCLQDSEREGEPRKAL